MPRMTRRTLALLPALALAAGCQETSTSNGTSGAPTVIASTAEAPAPTASASATPPASASAAPALPELEHFAFDKDTVDKEPAGFEFGKSGGKTGRWRVLADPTAPSAPNVLAQLDGDKTEGRVLTAIAAEPSIKDARVSVHCKPVSGKIDQACGLVVRFKDEKNYYVARASAVDKDVNLYVVKDGKRASLGGWKGANFGDVWHEIRLDVKGDEISLLWDGTQVFRAVDRTFDAGKVGLWTRADAVTYFDDLSITPL
jgi:hypothetical protein